MAVFMASVMAIKSSKEHKICTMFNVFVELLTHA